MILRRIYQNLIELGDRCAFVGSDSCTYQELGELAAGVAVMLRRKFDSAPVILYGGKRVKMLSWMLGCAFAGIPYVPVDVRTPTGRLDVIRAEVGGCIIDTEQIEIERAAPDTLSLSENADGALYIIMTSGSSGKPKGVMVSEANLDAFCARYHAWMGDAAVSLGHASFSFDLSVADIYPVLANGGCLYSIPGDILDSSAMLRDFVLSSGCERIVMTPSVGRLLLGEPRFREEELPSLKTVFFCGELLPAGTVLRLWERFPRVKIVNAYGPTECTVATHAVTITPEMTVGELPAGIADENVVIEDGEILLCGNQVAMGYICGQTDTFFVRNGKRFYRTGDHGKLCCGMLYIGGRMDRQLKLHGYRIEPGEIEQALMSLPGVSGAAVFALRGRDGAPRSLCGVAVCERDITELAAELNNLLPAYMIPTLHRVEALPLTANGKCDYAKLEATYGKG